MERTINQRKRKAEQRELLRSATTTKRHHQHHHHHHRHLRIEAPRFIGIRESATMTSPSSLEEVHVALFAPPSRPVTPREMRVDCPPTPAGRRRAATVAEACLASLPVELFCNVVAYLGPTSSSLCTLCRVSRAHNIVMTSIGDVMLHRARLRFRVPLPPRMVGAVNDDERGVGVGGGVVAIVESSVSLFVRHARVSKAVHDRLEGLEGMMRRRGFSPLSVPDLSSSSSSSPLPPEDGGQSDASPTECASALAAPTRRISDLGRDPAARDDGLEPSEVRYALNVALCLIGIPDRDYFDDPDLAHLIASQSSTTALERRVYAVCGEVGARSYKYAKSRMCRRYEGGGLGEHFLYAYHAVTDRMNRPALEDDSDYDDEDDDDDASVDASEMEADEDMMLLDKASLVMQHVFLREQEMARRRAQFLLL